jgi:transposase
MASPTSPTLLPDPSCLHLVRLAADKQSMIAVVATTSSGAFCPLCQSRSENIHSRYVRCVADLPWAAWAMRLELHVRRFCCQNKECVRRIFEYGRRRDCSRHRQSRAVHEGFPSHGSSVYGHLSWIAVALCWAIKAKSSAVFSSWQCR